MQIGWEDNGKPQTLTGYDCSDRENIFMGVASTEQCKKLLEWNYIPLMEFEGNKGDSLL